MSGLALVFALSALLAADDRVPPSITHSPRSQVPARQDVIFEAEIFDQSQIFEPLVYWRPAGTTEWKSLKLGRAGGDAYTATLPAAQVSRDFEYFLEAYDENGNGPARFAAPEKPYRVSVRAPAGEPIALAPPPPPVREAGPALAWSSPVGALATAGAGAALLAGGAALWFMGSGEISELDAKYPRRGMALTPEDRNTALRASGRTQMGSILMFAGLAGAAGGAAWWVIPRLGSGGAAVNARVDF